MKALTINIHSHSRIHEEKEYREMIKNFSNWVIKEEFDVIAIQECSQICAYNVVEKEELSSFHPCTFDTTITSDNCAYLIVNALKEKGKSYHWTWCSAKLGYSKYDEGLAILSKYPMCETEAPYISCSHDYNNWKTRKTVGCKVEIDGKPCWFYSVHMGWWKDDEEPFIYQMDTVDQLLKEKDGVVYLMGDFNSPANVQNEGYDYVKNKGWYDTYDMAKQKDDGITVPGTIDGWGKGVKEGMRIDYIWSNCPIEVESSKVMFSGKEEPIVSDHFGVCIEI